MGMAGAGYDCRLLIEKTDFTDPSIAAAIVDAADRHAGSLNMSFGPSSPSGPAPADEVRALEYAAARRVVLVAAAADSPTDEQGDPANVLQPPGTGSDTSKGLGLDITAADFSGGRAAFAGFGSEISLAAFGAFQPSGAGPVPCTGPPVGIFGAFPGNPTELEGPPSFAACRVAFQGDPRYATTAGTSMAAPQVAATAAMMRALNPYASVRDVLRLLKQTALRHPGTGWSSSLGWGVLDAGAALDATRRLDRLPPLSHVTVPRRSRHRTFIVRWAGHDQRRPGLIASGIAYYDIYVKVGRGRAHRLLRRTRRHAVRFHGRPGFRYVFFAVAVDRAGNRERRVFRRRTQVSHRAT
jgi:subtilisin family serine protease